MKHSASSRQGTRLLKDLKGMLVKAYKALLGNIIPLRSDADRARVKALECDYLQKKAAVDDIKLAKGVAVDQPQARQSSPEISCDNHPEQLPINYTLPRQIEYN